MHFARGNEHDLGPESGHMALANEALAHPRFESGIFVYHELVMQRSKFVVAPSGTTTLTFE
jgi:hypothetical protein